MFARPLFRPLLRLSYPALACGFFSVAAPLALADDTEAPAQATPETSVTSDAPAAPAKSIETLRDEAKLLREKADTTYKTSEAGCYHRFLVNHCIDKAKSERLAVIRQARTIEAEARTLDLAERSRAAAEVAAKAEKHGVSERSTTASPPTPDVATPTMPAAARATPRTTTSNRSAERAKTRAQAARRAEAARRDRERYDARVREYEEKKERDAAGR